MYAITHRVGINASAEAIYKALTTNEGLMTWWTNDVIGAGDIGSLIKFRFNGGGPDFKVIELRTNNLVRWQHSGDMPQAWTNTEVCFEIQPHTEQTFVNFSHTNWQESSEFMAHCCTKWGVFLLSLKDALEIGKGRAFPNDIHIDHS